MSTKIYDGIIFRSTDLLEIHHQIMTLRPVIRDLGRVETLAFYAREATQVVDARATTGKGGKEGQCALAGIWLDLTDRQNEIKRTGRRDPEVDLEFTIVLLPHAGRVYGMYFTERRDWAKALVGEDRIAEAYPYWNNTDPPDGIPCEEWDARGELWREILAADPDGRPGQCGFTVEIFPPSFWPDPEDILPFIPDRTTRLRNAARAIVLNRLVKPMYAAGEKPDPVQFFYAAEKVLRTDEGKAMLAEEEMRLDGILPEITVETLLDEGKTDRQGALHADR